MFFNISFLKYFLNLFIWLFQVLAAAPLHVDYTSVKLSKTNSPQTSLVIQWLRIHLPMFNPWYRKILPAMEQLSPCTTTILATWCEELTHWKRPWCWESFKAGGGVGDRGWDGWMASLTQWTYVIQTLGDSEGQGSLACCSPWAHKESHTT